MKYSLGEAIKFHGHLGPYLILGIVAGEFVLRKLKCKKYFGLTVKVYGALNKPKSCLIDGLQLSTGATYGKGNIQKFKGQTIRMEFSNKLNNTKIILKLKDSLAKQLEGLSAHRDSEVFARKLAKALPEDIFKF